MEYEPTAALDMLNTILELDSFFESSKETFEELKDLMFSLIKQIEEIEHPLVKTIKSIFEALFSTKDYDPEISLV
jgi:hypothetical protein